MFLLSYDEASEFFDFHEQFYNALTSYAETRLASQGEEFKHRTNGKAMNTWWLRTGKKMLNGQIPVAETSGSHYVGDENVAFRDCAVRPAIWVYY